MKRKSRELRVTLTGVHGTGKTYIVNRVAEELRSRGLLVHVMPSMTRLLKDAGFPINNVEPSRVFSTQLVCGALRKYQQSILDLDLKEMKVDVILSDRCIWDEVIYTNYFRLKSEGDLSVHTGLSDVTRSLLKLFEEELANNYWDAIFLKKPHPDFRPEDDGHRSTEKKFFKDIESLFNEPSPYREHHITELREVDRDAAAEEVLNWIVERI